MHLSCFYHTMSTVTMSLKSITMSCSPFTVVAVYNFPLQVFIIMQFSHKFGTCMHFS